MVMVGCLFTMWIRFSSVIRVSVIRRNGASVQNRTAFVCLRTWMVQRRNNVTATEFERLFEEQVERSRIVLVNKASEYATEDRLHNFKVAAALEGKTPEQALAGMMAKHTVSVYDMAESGQPYPIELWQEKITDHINYLFLLNAIVREGRPTEAAEDGAV